MDSLTRQFKSLSTNDKDKMLDSLIDGLGKMEISKSRNNSKKLDEITGLFSHLTVNNRNKQVESDVNDIMNSIVKLNMVPVYERPKKLKQIGKKIKKMRAKGRKWKNTSPKKSLTKKEEMDIFALMDMERARRR